MTVHSRLRQTAAQKLLLKEFITSVSFIAAIHDIIRNPVDYG